MPRRSAGVDPNQSPAPRQPARRTPRTCIHAKMPPRSRCRNALRRTIARRRSTRPSRRAAERCSIVGSTYAPAEAASLQRLAIGMLAHQGAPPRGLCRRDARLPQSPSAGAPSSECPIIGMPARRSTPPQRRRRRNTRSSGCSIAGVRPVRNTRSSSDSAAGILRRASRRRNGVKRPPAAPPRSRRPSAGIANGNASADPADPAHPPDHARSPATRCTPPVDRRTSHVARLRRPAENRLDDRQQPAALGF